MESIWLGYKPNVASAVLITESYLEESVYANLDFMKELVENVLLARVAVNNAHLQLGLVDA